MTMVLGNMMFQSQQTGVAPDENDYLNKLLEV